MENYDLTVPFDKYQNKWDIRFLQLARFISGWSKDPSTKVGGVIVDPQNRVVSMGYNGFPTRIKDTQQRLENRDLKYPLTIHAEMNAVLFAHRDLRGCTLYTWPFQTCHFCAPDLVQIGLHRHVSIEPTEDILSRWREGIKLAQEILKEGGIKLSIYPATALDSIGR